MRCVEPWGEGKRSERERETERERGEDLSVTIMKINVFP